MRRGLLEIEARKKSIDINGCYDKDEPYWKIGGWFKIVCSIEMPSILDIKKAEAILASISNKWYWDKGNVSAVSDVNDVDTVFFDEKVQFFNC
ncbi:MULTISPECIES: hypothetical protein [Bacillus]|uniref:hypothetical protein n=1 Tax=Bacillus TaxID=1386 RepID=UPI0015817B84|nr:hypothetical protein [Bacillus glycinifermentans]MBU8785030.1 hypothetical protein [Bacillus glycinifermentans]NUJ15205.1 hypothetical protein [Bacillus glycinifermentans]